MNPGQQTRLDSDFSSVSTEKKMFIPVAFSTPYGREVISLLVALAARALRFKFDLCKVCCTAESIALEYVDHILLAPLRLDNKCSENERKQGKHSMSSVVESLFVL